MFDNTEDLVKVATMQMPFGKHKGRVLIDLPDAYIEWFSKEGFPSGELGRLLYLVYEIKINGLEYLIAPLKSPSTEP